MGSLLESLRNRHDSGQDPLKEDECFLVLQLRRIEPWEIWEQLDTIEQRLNFLEEGLQRTRQQMAPVLLVMNRATMLNPSPHGY